MGIIKIATSVPKRVNKARKALFSSSSSTLKSDITSSSSFDSIYQSDEIDNNNDDNTTTSFYSINPKRLIRRRNSFSSDHTVVSLSSSLDQSPLPPNEDLDSSTYNRTQPHSSNSTFSSKQSSSFTISIADCSYSPSSSSSSASSTSSSYKLDSIFSTTTSDQIKRSNSFCSSNDNLNINKNTNTNSGHHPTVQRLTTQPIIPRSPALPQLRTNYDFKTPRRVASAILTSTITLNQEDLDDDIFPELESTIIPNNNNNNNTNDDNEEHNDNSLQVNLQNKYGLVIV